ncbi:MAG: flagellar basal body rod protein FlgC [Thermoleophilia bacterium]
MGMYESLDVSATGLAAQRIRMDVIANNLANVDSTTGVGQAYRRKMVVMQEATGSAASFQIPFVGTTGTAGDGTAIDANTSPFHGVNTPAIVEDTTAQPRVYEPGNPLADRFGYVTKPNVNSVTEMVDMVAATRSYQANVTAFEATKSMAKDALRLLQ